MKQKPERKQLSILLSLAMVIGLLPVMSLAAEAESDPIPYLDENGEAQTCSDYTLFYEETTWGEDGKETWYVLDDDDSAQTFFDQDRVSVKGDVNLILLDDAAQNLNRGIGQR